jgi:hypothetical protein
MLANRRLALILLAGLGLSGIQSSNAIASMDTPCRVASIEEVGGLLMSKGGLRRIGHKKYVARDGFVLDASKNQSLL